jgi:hypothetical protein
LPDLSFHCETVEPLRVMLLASSASSQRERLVPSAAGVQPVGVAVAMTDGVERS